MKQVSLFDIQAKGQNDLALGLVGIMPNMRAFMNGIAAKFLDGREHLVDKINHVAQREGLALTRGGGKTIKKDQLDKILQPLEQGHPPSLELIVCFCIATGDASPVKPLLDALGLTVIPKSDIEFLEYGKTCAALREAKERKKKLEARL